MTWVKALMVLNLGKEWEGMGMREAICTTRMAEDLEEDLHLAQVEEDLPQDPGEVTGQILQWMGH